MKNFNEFTDKCMNDNKKNKMLVNKKKYLKYATAKKIR